MYKKTEKILNALDTYPFKVFSNETILIPVIVNNEIEIIDMIYLDNTTILANACGLRDIGHRHGIEIKEDGTVTVITPIAIENPFISNPSDPFANRMFDALDELKRGEHLETQWAEDTLKDPDSRAMCFMMSKETYKKLYLQIIDGLIFVCMDVNIKEKDFEKELVSKSILEAVEKVEKGAFGIREVTGVRRRCLGF